MKKVSIIGAGLSGLTASILLAKEGFEVTIYEKSKKVGGNFTALQFEDHLFEFGPTFFTIPELLESIFLMAGKNIENYLDLEILTYHTHVYFENGDNFCLSTNVEEMIEQLKKVDSTGAENYHDFLAEIKRLYFEVNELSMNLQITNWSKLVKIPIRNLILKLRPFQSLDHFLRKYFENEQIIQLLAKYANRDEMLARSTPAFFAAFLYPILTADVFYVKGGTREVPCALKKLAIELGVKIYTEKEITKIHLKNNQVEGIQINENLSIESDYVLISSAQLLNSDTLLSDFTVVNEREKFIVTGESNLSQFVLLLGLDRYTNLKTHTVLFSSDVEREVEQILNGEFAENPTIYIYNPAFQEPERFKSGDCLVLMVSIPTNDLYSTSYRASIASYRHHLVSELKKYGFDLEESIVEEKVWTSKDLKNRFNSAKGGIHGAISKTFAAAYIRPPVKSDEIKGLYFTLVDTSHPAGSTEALKNGIHLATSIIEEARENPLI